MNFNITINEIIYKAQASRPNDSGSAIINIYCPNSIVSEKEKDIISHISKIGKVNLLHKCDCSGQSQSFCFKILGTRAVITEALTTLGANVAKEQVEIKKVEKSNQQTEKPATRAYYHSPSLYGCGTAHITTDIDTESSEQLDKFNKTCRKILKSLDNLVSSYSKIEIRPINEGERSSLTFPIYLAGNSYQEDGKYEVKTMHNETIFETAQVIIDTELLGEDVAKAQAEARNKAREEKAKAREENEKEAREVERRGSFSSEDFEETNNN